MESKQIKIREFLEEHFGLNGADGKYQTDGSPRDDIVERIAKWHERESVNVMSNLNVGSSISDYREANIKSETHKESAKLIRIIFS